MPTTSESQVPPPTNPDGPSLADWAEAAMFIEGRMHLSRTLIRQRLRGSHLVDGDELDLQVELLLSEVERRREISEANYPFEWSAIGISRREVKDEIPYEFLLWLSVSPHFREENRQNEIDELFDRLAKQALIAYLGSYSKGVRFAFPSSDGRPTGFPEAIVWLASLLGLSTGAGTPRPHLKDGGVDVVVWRPFKDRRSGFAVILCQCTVMRNWPPKAKDIVATKWNGWVDFGLNPLTAIVVPFSVPSSFPQWDEVRRTVNLVLDRMRLCELIDVETIEQLQEMKEWTEMERHLLNASQDQE